MCPVNPNKKTAFAEQTGRARYSIRKHIAFWAVDFEGQTAVFDHEQGVYYVAYLLLNPPSEPIHGMALEIRANGYFGQMPNVPCATFMVDPAKGGILTVGCDAMIVQRGVCADQPNELGYLRRKIQELESMLEDEDVIEPIKAEVTRELEAIYAFQKKNPLQITEDAQKAVRAVRMAILRFHRRLATAYTTEGTPDPVLRQFAFHLLRYLIIPSARYGAERRARTKTGIAGCFTYEAPAGVQWNA